MLRRNFHTKLVDSKTLKYLQCSLTLDNRKVPVKKAQAKIWKKTFPNFQICHNQFFLLENPTHWGLETAVCPIFVKPVLDIFAVCSLVLRINLSHTQQSYLCPKNQNYLLGKADFRFFLSYGLRTTIKITISSTFYVKDNFSSCYSRNSCKKI